MKSKLFRTVAGCLAAAVLLSVTAVAEPSTSARSSVLLDGTTGRILCSKNADSRSLIASTTKIMTGLLVAEECDLKASYAIPAEAVGVEGSSLHLKAGEIVTIEELLYGMMLHSGNDAALALAMYCAGTQEAFAEKMNRKAEELGLTGTSYKNPHGLDQEGHYSTALDLARLTACAMNHPVFRQVVSTKTIAFGNRVFTNHNKLLWRYDGAVGVKTGYTMAAGRILVSAAERDGRRLIAVTLHDRNDWTDHAALFDYGFSSFSMRQLAKIGQPMGSVPVIGGAEKVVQAVLSDDLECCLSEEETVELRVNLPMFVYAPILAGEQAGTLSVVIDGSEFQTVPLYWRYSVLEEA